MNRFYYYFIEKLHDRIHGSNRARLVGVLTIHVIFYFVLSEGGVYCCQVLAPVLVTLIGPDNSPRRHPGGILAKCLN